ncbi:MAG: 6-phosphogluconolactonase [Pirellulales bacterium]
MLEPLVLADYEALSQHAAHWLVARLREQPAALLCLAAGSTPLRTYELLAQRGAAEPTLFERCRLLKLDEWGGLEPDDPATCDAQLRSSLVSPLGLSDRYVAFDSQPQNLEAECERIAEWLKRNGPIDTCVLGLGLNGHVGFNEPADLLRPHAHVATLSESSLTHAMLRRSMRRPTYGLTLGMADLLQSQHVLLLVSGAAKRDALKRMLSGQITTDFPASLLQLHRNVLLICDAAAAE